ncbi:hypothetical protein QYF61_014041, partial [Mycteria americana]
MVSLWSVDVETSPGGVPQEFVLGPIPLHTFTNDVDRGIECTLSKFVGDTKLSGAVDMLEGRDAMQRDLDRLEELEGEWIESSHAEKGLGVLVDDKLDVRRQRGLAAQKANCILGCIKSSVASRLRELWGPQHQQDTDLLERVQRRATKMVRGLEHLSHEERLLEKRGLQGDFVGAFQYIKGAYKKDGERSFTRACSDRTRGNNFKLKEGRFRLDLGKKFFRMRVLRRWNRLPREVVDAPSLEVFKIRLDGALSNLSSGRCPCPWQGGLDRMIFEDPFQAKPFYDSMKCRNMNTK